MKILRDTRKLGVAFSACLLFGCAAASSPPDEEDAAETDAAADIGEGDVSGEDTTVDAVEDVAPDTGPSDTGADVPADVQIDVPEDVAVADVTVDIAPDTPQDVTEDTDTTPFVQIVDWCRLQSPTSHVGAPGSAVTISARVYDAGLTDRTNRTDLDASVVAELGFGPVGSVPDDTTWLWVTAEANPDWTDASEPGNDEYLADLTLPADTGTYDYAFRFSRDARENYTLCDTAQGLGADGAENGYQPEFSGALTVIEEAELCTPNPCTAPGEVRCNGDAVVENALPGTCMPVEGTASCMYSDFTLDDCSGAENGCIGGFCRRDGRPPESAGDILVTEIMMDAGAATLASWFELHNPTDVPLDLAGCRLNHAGSDYRIDATSSVPAGGYLVVGSTENESLLGTTPDLVWTDFGPADARGTIALSCYEAAIDAVTYETDSFESSISRQLDPEDFDPAVNDDWSVWCSGEESPGVPGGSPGAGNRECPLEPLEIGWCRLQFPPSIEADGETDYTIYSRVFAEGVTDETTGVDPSPRLIPEFGWGPEGSDPDDNPDWTWARAVPNETWDTDVSDEPGNDEYQHTTDFGTLDEGTYSYAFRYSGDAGASWLYCDRQVDGSDGAADGFQVENAGELTLSFPTPCDPNPCDSPPAEPTCEGSVAVTYPTPGECEVVDEEASCTYRETRTDCADTGTACLDGACTAPPVTINYCKLQFPLDQTVSVGAEITIYGRVYVAGLTDISRGIETYPALLAEAGYGPEGEDPSTWNWTRGEPNRGFTAPIDTAGDDEYQTLVTFAEAGTFRHAVRFSGDSGESWTYCDIGGASEDGAATFDVADAGTTVVTE